MSSFERRILRIWQPIDALGKALMGDLWKTFYESVQDAIALSLILQIPGLIGSYILGKEFSGFDVCLQEGYLSVDRYACFVIVTSDLCLWIVIAGRTLYRLVRDLRQLTSKNQE